MFNLCQLLELTIKKVGSGYITPEFPITAFCQKTTTEPF